MLSFYDVTSMEDFTIDGPAIGWTEEQLAEWSAMVAKINSLNPLTAIQVNTPTTSKGNVTIIIGQDHLQSNAQDLEFTNLPGPDISGGSVVYELRAQPNDTTPYKSYAGIVLGAHSATCEITKTESATLLPGQGTLRVMGTEAVGNGGETTELLSGKYTIKY
jgi:hypothetical protein